MRIRALALIVAALLCVPASSRVSASMVLDLDLNQLTVEADAIAVADVVSVQSQWESPGLSKRIVTVIELEVRERWKGPDGLRAGYRLKILQPGGTVGDLEMRVHGMPQFESGTRHVFFLRAHQRASALLSSAIRFGVVGMSQGTRRITFDVQKQEWMAAAADHAGVVRNGANGRLVQAPDGKPVSLSALKEQVLAAVKAAVK